MSRRAPEQGPDPALCHADLAEGTASLRAILLTVQRELLALQDLSTTAQLVMSYALEQALLDPGQWSQAQSLDLITQRLQGLATFAGDLSDAVPPAWTVDAAEASKRISLSDLAQRMACGAAELVPASNEVELF